MTDHIETLREHNAWRRGAEIPQPSPEKIGDAIDAAIAEIVFLRQKKHEVENAAWLGQAHVLCNELGVDQGHIENRLFEAIGKASELRELATCGCGDGFTEHDPGTCGNCVAGMCK